MQKKLFFFVLSIHFLWLLAFWQSPPPPRSQKKMVVHTKILPKKSVKPIAKASLPPSAKNIVPKPTPKKRVSKPSPKVNKAKELLQQLESNMATIESKLKKVEETTPFEPIQVAYENVQAPQESYFEIITSLFRQSLLLPEAGAVKVTITVQPNGEIAKIEPISVKSDENLRYLEKTLPHLRLPPPSGGSPLSITVTFCEM